MKIITLYNPILDRGGISVSYINIVNALSKNYPEVRFHLLLNQQKVPDIKLRKNIEIINIGKFSRIPLISILNWGKYLSSIKSIIGIFIYLLRFKPEYFVSFQGHFIVVICKYLSRNKTFIIARENTVIDKNIKFFSKNLFPVKMAIKKFTYKNVDKIVTLTEEATVYSANLLNLPEKKFAAIQNINHIKPLTSKNSDEISNKSLNPEIICLSRISREKGLDTIIKSFALIDKNINAKLILVGSGSYETEAKKLATSLGVYENCNFLGWIDDQKLISKLISQSLIFVSASLFEGFGNSIIEAMSCNTLVIALDVPFGPKEILENGKNGFLIPNNQNAPQELAKTFELVLNNPSIIEKYTKPAFNSLHRFEPHIIAKKWGKILNIKN